jgi:hypothetical protein
MMRAARPRLARLWKGGAIVDKDVPPPPAKPKLSAQERRARQEDRLAALRLRMAIGRALDERGIADPAAIGAALGLPAAAAKLLTRHQWRAGDVALLTAAAARLGVPAQGAPRAAAGDDGGDPGGQGG